MDSKEYTKRKAWDDEYVLKRQFSALIPAFDPRPGRTNVAQTQDFDIPAPESVDNILSPESKDCAVKRVLKLYIRGPGLPGVSSLLFFVIDL